MNHPHRLTFSDGLNFGCGFFVAGLLFSLLVVPLAALVFSAMSLFLIGLTGG